MVLFNEGERKRDKAGKKEREAGTIYIPTVRANSTQNFCHEAYAGARREITKRTRRNRYFLRKDNRGRLFNAVRGADGFVHTPYT